MHGSVNVVSTVVVIGDVILDDVGFDVGKKVVCTVT